MIIQPHITGIYVYTYTLWPIHVLCHPYPHTAQTQLVVVVFVVIIIFVVDVFVISIFCLLSLSFHIKGAYIRKFPSREYTAN